MTIFSSFGLAVVAVAVVVAVVASATAATCIDWAVLRCYSGSHRYSYRLGRLVLLFRRAVLNSYSYSPSQHLPIPSFLLLCPVDCCSCPRHCVDGGEETRDSLAWIVSGPKGNTIISPMSLFEVLVVLFVRYSCEQYFTPYHPALLTKMR